MPPKTRPGLARLNMDALQLRAASRCLQDALAGSKLSGLWALPAGLVLDIGGRFLRLQIQKAPLGIWLESDAMPADSHPFAGLARSQLQGMFLTGIEAPFNDRILRLVFERRHLTGRTERRALIAEWLGSRGNLILCDEADQMRFAWRWDDLLAMDARVLPQQDYRPPARFSEDALWYLAPRHRQHVRPDDEQQVRMDAKAAQRCCAPWHYLEREGQQILYPILLPSWEHKGNADFTRAWASLVEEEAGTGLETAQLDSLRQRLANALKRERETLIRVRADLARLSDPDLYRRWGQALYTLPDGIPNAAQIEALDYHAEPPEPMQIPVQAGRGLHEQAEHYFQMARRAERGAAQAQARLETLQARVQALDGLNDALTKGQAGPETLAAELDALYPAAAGKAARNRSRQAETAAEPLRLQVQGYEVLVGRSAQQNDLLTFKLARPWDVWLHVQDLAGAHVVIRMPKQEKRPPDGVLAQAAALAVRYSPRAGQAAEVDWTQARFVTRKPGGGPGQVLYRQFKTWHIKLDRD